MSDLEPDAVESKRAARERALELLYEAEVKDTRVADVVDALPVAPDAWVAEVVLGVDDARGRVDEILAERVAPRWTIGRLASVDRAVLRMGIYELLAHPDTPTAVILNEAVLLARRFGTDESSRFVNGVLAAVAEQVRSS